MKRLIAVTLITAMMALAVPSIASAAQTSSAATHAVTAGYVCQTCIPPPPGPAAQVQITFGWVIYVHILHRDTGGIVLEAFAAGAGAAMGYMCSLITVGVLIPVCVAIAAFAAYYFIGLANQAYSEGDGIVLEFTYGAVFFGAMAVPDSWT
jgi:hypothetical protein